jgi:tetratricopeptide (TPR) repeat protein
MDVASSGCPVLRCWLLLIAGSFSAFSQAGTIYEQAAAQIQNGEAANAIGILGPRLQQAPQDLKALTLMGMALTAQNHREEGNRYFLQALQVNPAYAPAVRNLALNEVAAGRLDAAKGHFERLVELAPSDPGARLGLAQVCIDLGQSEKAFEVLTRMPHEADPRAHFSAGVSLANIKRYAAAAHEFELAQHDGPDSYDAAFNLMLAYVKSRQYSKAVATGQKLLAGGARRAEVYNLLAQACEGDGKTAQAYEALRAATAIEPADPTNYLDLIALCLTHANYDLALEIADVAVARLPKSDRVHLQRGIVLAMKENFAGAKAEFENAVALAPGAAVPHIALGLMLLQVDQPAEAVAVLRRRIETGGDYLTFWFLGEALDRMGAPAGSAEEGEAIDALTRSVKANPDVPQPRILLAKLLARRGNFAVAEKHLTRALELDPENVSATYQLAQVCQKKGDSVRAKQLFAKVSQAKAEDREQFTRGGLQHIIRAGSQ